MIEAGLHFVDRFDEEEKGFRTFGLVGNIASGMVSRVKHSVVFKVFENITVNVEFLFGVHMDSVE